MNSQTGTEVAAACLPDGSKLQDMAWEPGYSKDVCPNFADRGSSDDSPWHALRVRPRWEKIVAEALRGKDYEEFLPLYRKCSQWSDRSKQLDLPLFPGYVFFRGFSSNGGLLVTTPGVIGILKFGQIPAIISNQEIENIASVLRSGLHTEPWPYIREGQRVRIHQGPLSGLEGLFIQTRTNSRLLLSVDALCRSVVVEVDRECVVPLDMPPVPSFITESLAGLRA